MNKKARSEKNPDDMSNLAEETLDDIDPTPFSPSAFDFLKKRILSFSSELIVESRRTSKRHKSDMVSVTHVEKASDYLVTSKSRRFARHLGTIGGILCGAAFSNFLAMALAETYATAGVLLSAGFAVVGSFLVAFNIARD